MSVSTQIERLQADRNTIRNKLIELGLAQSGENLTTLAATIAEIVDQGAVQVEILEGTSYTIPAGYHNGSGTVKAMTDTTGEAEKYKVQTKTVTPTKGQQNITPDTGYYALGAVTVNAIPAAYQDVTSVTVKADEVLVGKIFVAEDGKVTTGTMADNGAVSKTLDGTMITYTIPAGYHNGSGKVNIVLEEKTVVPSKAVQTVTPTKGKVLSKVTVAAITDNFVDTTDATAKEDQLLSGQTAYTYETNASGVKSGKKITGTMMNNGAVNASLSPAVSSYSVPQGYHNGSGKVTVASGSVTVNPTKETQRLTDTTAYFDAVYVNPIPDEYQDVTNVTATADKVKTGSKFVDSAGNVVDGTMPDNGTVNKELYVEDPSYTIPAGYHSGNGKIKVKVGQAYAITPEKEEQTYYNVDMDMDGNVIGKMFWDKVIVGAIPDRYQDVTGVTATAANVLDGKYIVTADGTLVEGTMTNRGAVAATMTGLTDATASYTIPSGYHNGSGKVRLTSDIETALAAI